MPTNKSSKRTCITCTAKGVNKDEVPLWSKKDGLYSMLPRILNCEDKFNPHKTELEEIDDEHEDSFDKIYKGEISKSGAAILPSKRVRRMPEKVNLEFKKLAEKNENKDNQETTKETEATLPENNSEK